MDDPTKSNYKHVLTLLTNRFDMAARLEIAEGLVLTIKDLVFDFNIEAIINSDIGAVPTDFVKNVVKLF